ncbi:MAG TPA: hypothetical protein VGO93_04380 [Candidatus Xenobia bacterium]|jgi:hypothetical protein
MADEGPVTMAWEEVACSGAALKVVRTRVRGGWLVNVTGGSSMNTVFVADERHRWVEGWDSPDYYLR